MCILLCSERANENRHINKTPRALRSDPPTVILGITSSHKVGLLPGGCEMVAHRHCHLVDVVDILIGVALLALSPPASFARIDNCDAKVLFEAATGRLFYVIGRNAVLCRSAYAFGYSLIELFKARSSA